MKFKITEISTLKIKVEYEDGSWASIPTLKDANKAYYAKQIQDYCHTPQEPVPVNTIPYKVGDEGTVGDDVPETTSEPQEFDYGAARALCYPTLGLQFDALYHGRKGDSTKQDAVDAHILMVKEKIPNDSKVYTFEEVDAILTELKKDSKWLED